MSPQRAGEHVRKSRAPLFAASVLLLLGIATLLRPGDNLAAKHDAESKHDSQSQGTRESAQAATRIARRTPTEVRHVVHRGQEPEANGVIAGQVTNALGDPIEGAQIGASSATLSRFTTSAKQGRFELKGLGTDPMNVFATAPGYAAAHVNGITVGTRELIIILEAPAQVRATFAAELPAKSYVRVCRTREGASDLCVKSVYFAKGGRDVVLERLPAGKFDLVIASERDEELARVPVVLQPGGTTELSQIPIAQKLSISRQELSQ